MTNSRRVWRQNTRGDFWTYDLASGHMAGIGHHVTEINGDLFRNSGFFTRTNKPAQK